MTWQEVSLILGILVIIVGGLIKLFGNRTNKTSSIQPKRFYDIEKIVGEQGVEFKGFKESMNGKMDDLQEDIRESNKKIDELTKLLIDFVKNS